MNLNNYTLAEVLALENNSDYFVIAKNLNPKNLFKFDDINDMPFGLIKELHAYTYDTEKMIEFFVRLQTKQEKITAKQINDTLNIKFFDFFYQWRWVEEEILKTVEMEQNFLSYDPTGDEIEAGIENLYKFGAFATVDGLANGNPLVYQEIESLPYGMIFTKLYLDSVKDKFQRDYHKIITRK